MDRNRTLRQWAGLARPAAVKADKTALLLIDLQQGYFTGGKLFIPDGEQAAANAARLLCWARRAGIVVAHIQHKAMKADSPLFAPHSPDIDFHELVKPATGETIVSKHLPSSFSGTELQKELNGRGIEALILCGLMTHMCVDSTARAALELGYKVIVAADACASRDLPDPNGTATIDHKVVHQTALAALGDRFADILRTEEIVRLPMEKI